MLRAVWWTLRQRRYASLAGAMVCFSIICIGIGTFEIHRYREKKHDNAQIVGNADAPVRPLDASLVSLAGRGPTPDPVRIRYRRVSATGTFDPSAQRYVDDQDQGGRQGFYVLTPLRTADGVLLVVRGFVAATSSEARPAVIAAAPTGVVRLVGRLEPAQTASEQDGRLGRGEITAINPVQESARLGAPVFAAYLTLAEGQPGTADLTAVPAPDLSNPTGGASQLQLLSYVVQWYAFAVLALLAPVLFARSEVREARKRYLGIDPERVQFDLEYEDLAVRELAGGAGGGEVVLRRAGSLARVGDIDPQQLRRARRLADRYGRSLTFGPEEPTTAAPATDEDDHAPRRRDTVDEPFVMATRRSAQEPHRSPDDYHASYNDYLWELALADGEMPAAGLGSAAPDAPAAPRVVLPDDLRPRVIDAADPADADDPGDQPHAR